MSKSIWKFPFEVTDEQEIKMPIGAQILSVQMQGDKPCIWVLVDTTAQKENRTVQVFGTGNPVSNEGKYIGTFQMCDGARVFHTFIK